MALKSLAIEKEDGYRVPTIKKLSKIYGASLTPISRALRELCDEGYLECIPGNGTFVRKGNGKKYKEDIRNIALFLDRQVELTHPYYSELIHSIVSVADEHGYNVMMIPLKQTYLFSPENDTFIERFHRGFYSGMILAAPVQPEDIDCLLNSDVPFVNINEEYCDERFSSILIDRSDLVFKMMGCCVDRGRKNILFIGANHGQNGDYVVFGAYQTFLKAYDLEGQNGSFVYSHWKVNDAYSIVMEKFGPTENNKPDAIVTLSGRTAYGAYCALRELNIRVPEDVMVVQGNSVFMEPEMKDKVPFIRVDVARWCRKAVDVLAKKIEGETVINKKVYIKPSLCITQEKVAVRSKISM